jgi:hypothetical protein
VTLLEKKQRRSAILGELKTLRDSAKLTNRSLSADEQTKFDALLAEDATLKGEIETEEANEKRLNAIGDWKRNWLKSASARPSPIPRAAAVNARTADVNAKPAKFKSLGEQLQAIAHAGMHGDNPGSSATIA